MRSHRYCLIDAPAFSLVLLPRLLHTETFGIRIFLSHCCCSSSPFFMCGPRVQGPLLIPPLYPPPPEASVLRPPPPTHAYRIGGGNVKKVCCGLEAFCSPPFLGVFRGLENPPLYIYRRRVERKGGRRRSRGGGESAQRMGDPGWIDSHISPVKGRRALQRWGFVFGRKKNKRKIELRCELPLFIKSFISVSVMSVRTQKKRV